MYEIWQLKRGVKRDFWFRSYDNVVSSGEEVSQDNYEMVYAFDCEDELGLDDIYCKFNINRPDDFMGHSLSVSDVVKIPDGYYYCDPFGWKKLDWGC